MQDVEEARGSWWTRRRRSLGPCGERGREWGVVRKKSVGPGGWTANDKSREVAKLRRRRGGSQAAGMLIGPSARINTRPGLSAAPRCPKRLRNSTYSHSWTHQRQSTGTLATPTAKQECMATSSSRRNLQRAIRGRVPVELLTASASDVPGVWLDPCVPILLPILDYTCILPAAADAELSGAVKRLHDPTLWHPLFYG